MSEPPLWGLIPAAGQASRLGPLPLSKELLPASFRETASGPVLDVACRHLLEGLHRAGVRQTLFVLREEKLDIPRYLTRHLDLAMDLAYVPVAASASVPETLDRAYPFIRHCRVALGFPDILFEPRDAFARLVARQAETGADGVLGLFPWDEPQTSDMVALGDDGRVEGIEVRPWETRLTHNWLLALWTPRFTEYLHEAMKLPPLGAEELQLGTLFGRAIADGLDFRGVRIDDGRFLDIGTKKGYSELLRRGLDR